MAEDDEEAIAMAKSIISNLGTAARSTFAPAAAAHVTTNPPRERYVSCYASCCKGDQRGFTVLQPLPLPR